MHKADVKGKVYTVDKIFLFRFDNIAFFSEGFQFFTQVPRHNQLRNSIEHKQYTQKNEQGLSTLKRII